MSLSIETKFPSEGTTRLELHGRLDSNTTPQLDEVLDGVLDGTRKNVVYDLSDLEYISSAGLRAIFRTKRELDRVNGGTAVVNPQAPVRRVFEIVQALPVESLFTSWAEADQYFDQIQKKVRDGDA
ncbi:MAG: STAS domain-containing protein [Planctomycetota bacterium]